VGLTPGTRLGPYEIVAPIGAGGMGEVWRARDTRLGRDVAIKALPEAFAQDPERLARFEREARLLATLSHANVAGIHGLELVEGHRYLVLEFVEGETLAARLARGPLAPDEVREVCRQVAAGVEAAHEAGVVHRDLKPGNVMLRSDGTVKVLDFGLAKAGAAHGASSDPSLSLSPTLTHAATGAGVILGTAAYMSPEQARGRAVDRRTDVWSFGCVLYECLTGRRVFDGETVSDMVARILEREPDWSALPAATPHAMRALLERCLTKDVKQRLQAIGEARIALEQPIDTSRPAGTGAGAGRLSWLPWGIAGAASIAVVVLLVASGRRAAEPERRVELGFPAGQSRTFASCPMISPDGRRIAVVAADSSGTRRVWIRDLEEPGARPVKGTDGAEFVVWSPDSRSLAMVAGEAISRLSVDNGVAQRIVAGIGEPRGMDWGADGRILYTPGSNAGIWMVPANGGAPVELTHVDTTLSDASHRYPVWLPDGRHFLFALWSNNPRVLSEAGGIYLGSTGGGPIRRISPDIGHFVLLRSGYLLVRRNAALTALPFDTRTFRVGNEAIPIANTVEFTSSTGMVAASASAAGDIVLDPALDASPTDLAWIDRSGRRGAALGLPSGLESVTLARDGTRAAGEVTDETGLGQVWIADLLRRTLSPLTRSENDSSYPQWSPDGRRIVFCNQDSGTRDIYVQPAEGTRPKERLWPADRVDAYPTDWSADGRYLLFTGIPRSGATIAQVWLLDLRSDSARALLAADYTQGEARFSPDGRWIAYTSSESGRPEVYVRPFPDLERKWLVSTGGGRTPCWRNDSRELVYENGSGSERALWSVAVTTPGGEPSFGEPRRLFTLPADVEDFSPAADHSRFLALIRPVPTRQPPMQLVLSWRPGGRR